MLSNAPAERLFHALGRSLRYTAPDVQALPSLSDPRVLWTLTLVLGVWADLSVLPAGWLRDDIEDAIGPLRNEPRVGQVLRAAEAATRATTATEFESAARYLGAALSSVGAEVLSLLVGSPQFETIHKRVEAYAPRPSGGNAMAADDQSFDDEDLPFEGETRDVELPTAHTSFDPQGPWVHPDALDGLPTEGMDWTKVAEAGVDAAKDFLTGVTRGNYQPPPGTTPQPPPGTTPQPPRAEPPRPPMPPPPVAPQPPPATARSSSGSGLLWGLFGLAVLAGGAVAVSSGGRRRRGGDVL
jgi:hypothetical protein